eukprot:scaffold15406_cov119-Isochrysis_galbana.AAC.8
MLCLRLHPTVLFELLDARKTCENDVPFPCRSTPPMSARPPSPLAPRFAAAAGAARQTPNTTTTAARCILGN